MTDAVKAAAEELGLATVSRPPTDADEEASEADGEASGKPSQATLLVELCKEVELFHDDDEAFATVTVAGRIETFPVRNRAFKRWLMRSFHQVHKKPPSSQAMTDALGVLEGQALFDGPQIKVFVRVAEHQGVIYLDLADTVRTVVEIDAHGWRKCESCPVRFRRPRAVEALPMPVPGGSLSELRRFINADDRAFVLIVAWLVCSLRPGFPVPVLLFVCPQGSGKSTASKILRLTVDPNTAAIRSAPKEPRDLMIAAKNGLVIALNNLSSFPDWLSDAICCLSTGGGFGTRTLFENDDETIFSSLRPVILNGIEEFASKGDLLDRAFNISLPRITEDKRQTERDLYAGFNAAHPRLLGALLTAVSTALRRVDEVKLASIPRMADCVQWIMAAEPSLPWPVGEFMRVYAENRAGAHELAIEAMSVGPAVIRLMEAEGHWTGTASQLLERLGELVPDATVRNRDWPKRPHTLGGQLRRLAPNLLALGVEVEFNRTKHGRALAIRKIGANAVTSVTERHYPLQDRAKAVSGDAPLTDGDARVTHTGSAQVLEGQSRDADDAQSRALSDGAAVPAPTASGEHGATASEGDIWTL